MAQDTYKVFLDRFGNFTQIQKAAFEIVSSGEDCIITAPTGSGKTEAAIIPIFDRIIKGGSASGIQAIYITPLRALNRDLMKRFEVLSKELGISVSVRHGDTPTKERQLQAAHPPQVLITTPETLQNLFLSERLRASLANVKAVIVDELHELYTNKRGVQLAVALERLSEVTGAYQRIGISATIGDAQEARRFLSHSKGCRIIESKTSKRIEVDIEMPQKPERDYKEFREKFSLDGQALARIERISQLIRGSNSTLLFANTRQVVESLGSKLLYFEKMAPFGSIGIHHGSLDKEERISVENAFKEGRTKGIIATSSLELGIDIGSINLVIQYGSPKQVTRLLQRVGRGGHREMDVSYGKILVANYIDAIESLSIIDQMRKGAIEPHKIEENALDVLANQICGIVLEYKTVSADKAYGIIKRAAPYAGLGRKDFDNTIKFLSDERLLRVKEDTLGIGTRSRPYFFTHISVIPDSMRFYVKNVSGNRTISSLDEKFVSNYLEEGSVFITKGMPWKVISIEKDVINVEPSAELEAAVPDWEGEDIPVSHQTVTRVFDLIREGSGKFNSLLDAGLQEGLGDFIERQRKSFVPNKDALFVEELEDYAIMYCALGKFANEFIAKIVGHAASQISGTRLLVKATPYAIIVDYSGARKLPGMRRVVDIIKNYDIDDVLSPDGIIAGTDLFRYKFVQVCKLFGIVEKKATVTKRDADRLIKFYKNSPICAEALRDLRKNYLDIPTSAGFLEGLRKGSISVHILQGTQSPLTKEIMSASFRYKELLLPALPDDETVKEFRGRIEGKRAELLCTFCGLEFAREVKLESDQKIRCPNCSSPMVCMHSDERAKAISKRLSGKKLGPIDYKAYGESLREASLVEAYGYRAIAALETYGIGLSTAARVLKLLRVGTSQFLVDLIEAQKTFVKTKRYWK